MLQFPDQHGEAVFPKGSNDEDRWQGCLASQLQLDMRDIMRLIALRHLSMRCAAAARAYYSKQESKVTKNPLSHLNSKHYPNQS
jgi:hypothetical protein